MFHAARLDRTSYPFAQMGLARVGTTVSLSIAGAAVAAAVLVLQVVIPVTQGFVVAWPQDYFRAMAHFFKPDVVSYPFFWSLPGAYRLGTLTPLIAAGGIVALVAGYSALRAGARVAVVPFVVGAGALLAFVVGAAVTQYAGPV